MTDYKAYMLRMWQEDSDQTMRFSLESPTTGERLGFSDLKSLVQFLSQADLKDVKIKDIERGEHE